MYWFCDKDAYDFWYKGHKQSSKMPSEDNGWIQINGPELCLKKSKYFVQLWKLWHDWSGAHLHEMEKREESFQQDCKFVEDEAINR